MAEQIGSSNTNTLLIVIPSRGELDWDQDIKNLCFIPISTHDHTGQGNGAQISTEALVDGSVTTPKIANNAITTDKIQDAAVTANKLNADVTGAGLTRDGSNALTVDIDESTLDFDIFTDKLKVAQDGITTVQLADGAVLNNNLTGDCVRAYNINSDVAGNGLTQNSSTGALQANVDNATIQIHNDVLQVGFISSANLETSLENRIAAIETAASDNASNITSNDSDISALDSRLTTAESNITSNDSDISGLDSRVTTLESSSSSGNLTVLAATKNNVSHIASPTEERDVFKTNALYDPSSLVDYTTTQRFITPSTGYYLLNISATFSSASTSSNIKVYVGTSLSHFIYTSDEKNLVTGDVFLSLTANDQVRVTVQDNDSNSHVIGVTYNIKKID